MAAKSQSKVSSKSSKSTPQGGKTDTKQKKKVTLADEDEVEEPGVLAYTILSAEQSTGLLGKEVEEIQKSLCEQFKLEDYTTDLKDGTSLDFYTAAVWFAKEQGFDSQQLSGFFTVIHTLYDNVKEKHMAMVDNLKEFKKMLIGIEPHHPNIRSSGLDFFNKTQAKRIATYINTSLFQHYKLYELMFTQTQAEEIIGTDLEIEVAKPATMPFPPPLDEGVSEEMFMSYIATPPPTPPPEEGADEDTSLKELENKIEEDLFTQLTPEDIRDVIESVTKDMLGSLQTDLVAKLRLKENDLIARINKVHRIAEDVSSP